MMPLGTVRRGAKRGPIRAKEPLVRSLLTAVANSHLSDAEIAFRAGTSHSAISKLRTGDSPSIQLHLFIALAAIVELDVTLAPREKS